MIKKAIQSFLGGNCYHNGFTLGYNVCLYEGVCAVFDVSHLKRKKLSFMLGSTEYQYIDYNQYSIVNVCKTPQRLTGITQ